MILIGEHFVAEGLITEDQLELGLQRQRELGGREHIGKILVDMGYISERDRVRALGAVWSVPFVDVTDIVPQQEALETLAPIKAHKFRALPIIRTGQKLTVAMANPMDIFVIDEIRLITGLEVEPYIAVEDDLIASIQANYKLDFDVNEALAGVIKDFAGEISISDGDDEELSEAELRELGEDAPIIRLANLIISQGVTDRASDIHLEPMKDGMVVRYRIDGVLVEAMRLPRKVVAPLTSRVKIMSDMDIAEKRAPQDNRISATIGGKEFDFRVSSLPVVHGEKIVMRVLDKGGINVGLSKLGFSEQNLKLIQDWCSRSYGIILVTGPTGSGKSTTLYSALHQLNDGSNNIITIEDPVEYELPGINQCGVNVRAGMTFAAGLRAMLRQDPDVIMVGEMRDSETATIAMEAALTGHLVLSTLHTNDAPSAATRLIDMEVEPFLISSSIVGVMAQRLLRTICNQCKETVTSPKEVFLRCGLPIPDDLRQDGLSEVTLFRGKGCDYCRGTGYKGRTGIHELMTMTDEIKDKILERAPSHMLAKLALQSGMVSIQTDAVMKILKGITTVDEVLRVIYS